MNFDLDEVLACLESSGYTLSPSHPRDILIRFMLEHELKARSGMERLYVVNSSLYELELPRLEP